MHVTDRSIRSIQWCPITLRLLPRHACLGRDVHGDAKEIWEILKIHWQSTVKNPSWKRFLLQLDFKGQSCADGWRRDRDTWGVALEESREALHSNMFTEQERADPCSRDYDSGITCRECLRCDD